MSTPTPVPHPPTFPSSWTEIDTSTDRPDLDTRTHPAGPGCALPTGPLHDLIANAMQSLRLKTPNDFRRSARLSCSEFARLSTPARPGPDTLDRLAVALNVSLSVLMQHYPTPTNVLDALPSTPSLNLNPDTYQPHSLLHLITRCMERHDWTSLEDFARHAELNLQALDTLIHLRAITGPRALPNWATVTRLALALEVPTRRIIEAFHLSPPDPSAQHVPLIFAHDTTEFPHELRIDVDFIRGRALVAYSIQDTTMTGGPQPVGWGDVVLVDPHQSVRRGDMVLAHCKDNTAVCRILRLGGVLEGTLPDAYWDVSCIYPEDIAQLIGPVVGIVSSLF